MTREKLVCVIWLMKKNSIGHLKDLNSQEFVHKSKIFHLEFLSKIKLKCQNLRMVGTCDKQVINVKY